ncbi:uncharacterized protein Veg [Natranaerovirga hydrolytica]|uniref:Uncharacterized protein Veg n=1 Tax=Natranaerovirga hydrolytica TaxID=680378 RepID=A0A4R1MTJ0_9FIRM|nr:uncharacterized protein Veg [Natranaerovirga hydrolytica]
MLIAKEDIIEVKRRMDEYVGSRVKVKANKGRRKIVVKEGVLEQTYPSIFVVKVENELQDSYRRVSYSYTDLLTHSVELSLCREN